MKKILIILIFFNIYLFSNSSILILNSYHKGYEYSDEIVKGIEEVLYKNINVDVTILYMDAKRISSKEYFDNLKKLYEVQLKNREFDLIITIDNFAYEFILNNYSSFFKNEKIFAVGIDDYSYEKVKKLNIEYKVSAHIKRYDFSSNIKLINKLMPELETLYIIDDSSLNAKKTKKILENIIPRYKDFNNIKHLKADDLNELNKRFSSYKKNEAILFVRFYKNKDGKLNKNIQISNFIKNSKIPVFINDSVFIGDGAVGGRIFALNKFGINSGKMALEFVNTHRIIVKVSSDLEYVFDSQKLKEFNLFPYNYLNNYKLVNKDLTFFDKNRKFIDYVFLISPLLLILIFALIKNIYKRFEVEKKLRNRIHFDTVMLNAIDSPILWQDKNGVIVDANSEFCSLVKIELNKLKNEKLKNFSKNKKVKIVQNFLKKYESQGKKHFKFRFQHKDLNEKIYLIKQAKYSDKESNNAGTVTFFTDITSERALEVETKRNQQFMVQQSKLAELGEIFSAIAHQWKAPLVEITTIAQEIFYSSTSKKDDKNESESYVGDIIKQVKYMNDTINDFQDFIKPSHNKHTFSVVEAINSMLDIVDHNIKYNYININIEVKDNTNVNVYGFRNEFMQSFLNIINNAKDVLVKNDFNNRNININIFNEDNYVIIEIQDNAGGIKAKNLGKVFTPYFSTKSEGHGIGLYMVRIIIEDKMNGKITAKNAQNGAYFTIKLGQKNENTNT